MKWLGIFLILLGICALLKSSRSHYFAFGYNWNGNRPHFAFGHGKGWVVAMRNDDLAKKEMLEKTYELKFEGVGGN